MDILDIAVRLGVATLIGVLLGLNRDLHGKSTGVRASHDVGATGGGARIRGGEVSFEPPFTSFDHLVGAQHQRRRHLEADRFRGPQVDRQLEPGWLLDRHFADFLAA